MNNYNLIIEDSDKDSNSDEYLDENLNNVLEINDKNKIILNKMYNINIENLKNIEIIKEIMNEFIYLSSLHEKICYELRKDYTKRIDSVFNKYTNEIYFINRNEMTKIRILKRKLRNEALKYITNDDTKKYINLYYKNIVKF